MKNLLNIAAIITTLSVMSGCDSASTSSNAQNSSTAGQTESGSGYTFERGYPNGTTATDAYDAMDLRRAIEAYKWFVATLATEAVMQQMAAAGAKPNENGIVMATSPQQQFGAPNSDTPYALTTLDLKAGPMVVELPANPLLLGFVNDHNQRWVVNMGGIGPDKGEGGKHLILPPGYEGTVPDGYFVSRSKTWKVVAMVRTVALDGDNDAAIKRVQKVKVYPLAKAGQPAPHRFINVSDKRLTLPLLDWEGKLGYWRQLHAVISSETAPASHRPALGALYELGIRKGEPFDPDARSARMLAKAADIAHKEMLVSLYANRRGNVVWQDRQWLDIPVGPFHAGHGDFGTADATDLDAGDAYYVGGWGTSSSIGKKKVGAGSIYYMGFKGQDGAYLDGGKSYKLNLPGPVPAGLFWSATVYDVKTRFLIETEQGRAAVRSHLDSPQANPDGSYDVYFGPTPPPEPVSRNNWVQTAPDLGWFTLVRLYSPKQAVFDGSWKLGDIIEIEMR